MVSFTVSLDPPPAPPAPSHTFISLPQQTANAILRRNSEATLAVLRVEHDPPFHLCWAGAVTTSPHNVCIPSPLAETHGLYPGQVLSLAVVEIVPPPSRHPATVLTLRPTSYEACHPTRPTSYHVATAHFTQLSATAAALEATLLPSLRVVTPGRVYPLALPAGLSIAARVASVETTAESAPFVVLMPDTRVLIEPPPQPPAPPASERIRGTYRCISLSRASASGLPRSLSATHAVLYADEQSRAARAVLVSRKVADDQETTALPVALAFHPAIPKRHVALPPALWHDLHLASLTPVLLDEVSGLPTGDAAMCVTELSFDRFGLFPAFEVFSQTSAVYYHGMLLRNMLVQLEEGKQPILVGDVDLWDKEGIRERDDDMMPGVYDLRSQVGRKRHVFPPCASKRRVRLGFRSFPEQALLRSTPGKSEPNQSKGSVSHEPTKERPLRGEDIKRQAILSLTKSGRTAIDHIIRLSRSLFRSSNPQRRKCKAVVLEGALGAGKTHLCKVVASLLRELANVRAIWVRCRVHAGESTAVSVNRVRRAFRAASDGGPGLVVLDDIDVLTGTRKSAFGPELDDNGGQAVRKRQALAKELEEHLEAPWSESVLLLMTCQVAKDLDVGFRSPGVINAVMELPLPVSNERALIYWMALQDLDYEQPVGDGIADIRQEVGCLGELSEGFSPRDIHISLKRAGIALDLDNIDDTGDIRQVVRILKETVKTMTPSTRSGIKFSEDTKESLVWSAIGGLDSAKSAIWDALQLPSSRPDIFAKVPIRLPHGILLYGPPGCGKTMLARTAAAESGMRCVMVKGPELLSKYIGESEAEVRRAFEKAASSTPCVLLFDEFDSLAPRRGGESTGVADRVVNTLLTCMDGAERLSEGVYVLATTSRPELIDPALLRPGRLDRWIPVDVPSNKSERLHILHCLCSKFFTTSPPLESALETLAENTEGYTGADLGAIINDAHLSYTKLQRRAANKEDSPPIPELLSKAYRESRPSLSRSQRSYFRGIMAKFAPDQRRSADKEANGVLRQNSDLFGKKLALQ